MAENTLEYKLYYREKKRNKFWHPWSSWDGKGDSNGLFNTLSEALHYMRQQTKDNYYRVIEIRKTEVYADYIPPKSFIE